MTKRSWPGMTGLVSLALAGLALLSGCSVGVGLGMGPVGVYFGVYADPNVTSPEAKRFLGHLQNSLRERGYQITQIALHSGKRVIGFTARRQLASADIARAEHLVPGLTAPVLVSDGSRVRVETALNLKSLETRNAQVDSSLHGILKVDFAQPPTVSNANQVENQGKALEWVFRAADATPMRVEFAS